MKNFLIIVYLILFVLTGAALFCFYVYALVHFVFKYW